MIAQAAVNHAVLLFGVTSALLLIVLIVILLLVLGRRRRRLTGQKARRERLLDAWREAGKRLRP